jgi:hypothetical protein
MADKYDPSDDRIKQAYAAGFSAGKELGAWSMLAIVVLIGAAYYFW